MKLSINGFGFGYPGYDNLINNFNLSLVLGQKCVLLGYNGVGKSSVLKAVWESGFLKDRRVKLPLRRTYLCQEIDNSVNLNPQDIRQSFYELQFESESSAVQYLAKSTDFENNLFEWFSESVCALPNDFQRRLNLNLFDLKLSPLSMAGNYSDLSPGTKKKLLIAILFATDPQLIIVDELTNHLDSESIKIVTNWVNQSNAAMLIVDHSESFLKSLGRVDYLFLPNNKQREVMSFPDTDFETVLGKIEDIKIRQEIEQEIVLRRKKQLESQLELARHRARVFNSDIGSLATNIKNKLKWEVEQNTVLQELDLRKEVVFQNSSNKDKIKKDLLFGIDNLQYLIGKDRFATISEQKIYKGEKIRIIGPNGRGKSTLLGLIRLSLDGKIAQSPQYLQGKVEFGNQSNKPKIFVLEQVTGYGHNLSIQSFLQDQTKMQVWEMTSLLKNLELSKFDISSNLSHLSVGEFIRLQLGILSKVIAKTDLLILDEPGNFLDIFTQQALLKMLQGYRCCLIFVTHDQSLAHKIGYEREIEL